jgi:hypothetical protein
MGEAGSKRYADAAGTPRGKAAGGLLGWAASAFREEYRLAMMDPGDAAAERRKQNPVGPPLCTAGFGVPTIHLRL